MSQHFSLLHRPRRIRKNGAIRELVQETRLSSKDLVWPLFVVDGKNKQEPIPSMPNVYRWSPDQLLLQAQEAFRLGIPAIALFPAIADSLKTPTGKESTNPDGLLPTTIQIIKEKIPDLIVITDVALDPYSSDGHDGIVENGKILNDATLEVLGAMAIVQSQAGADFVAPSDMMDGRVGYLRNVLDGEGHSEVGIVSYTAKYASSFYGPFRDALQSTPRFGDKKTYQMNPANAREALRELALDVEEGADMVMVKPALPYLDVLRSYKPLSHVPLAAYQVSGELAMIEAAGAAGWIDRDSAVLESLICIKRAGADFIFTYFAKEVAERLN